MFPPFFMQLLCLAGNELTFPSAVGKQSVTHIQLRKVSPYSKDKSYDIVMLND